MAPVTSMATQPSSPMNNVHGFEAGEVEEREESRLAPAWGRRSRERVGEKRYEDGRGGGGSMNQRGKQGQ
jgi:hypothetical protein